MEQIIAEFVGTAVLLLLGNGIVANVVLKGTKGFDAGWISITAGWGVAVFVAVLCVGEISGAHINPAVTIGLAIAGQFPWASVPAFCIAQVLGAMVGTTLVWIVYGDHYDATEDAGSKLATFCTGPAIASGWRNFASESIGTFVLVFAVLQAAKPSFEMLGDFSGTAEIGLGALGALPVGLVVLSIGLSLGGTTGYAINPARDLGPRIMHAVLPIRGKGSSEWHYAWVPVIGPIAGAAIAAVVSSAMAN